MFLLTYNPSCICLYLQLNKTPNSGSQKNIFIAFYLYSFINLTRLHLLPINVIHINVKPMIKKDTSKILEGMKWTNWHFIILYFSQNWEVTKSCHARLLFYIRPCGLVFLSTNPVKPGAVRRRTEPIRGLDKHVYPALETNVGVRESASSCVLFTNVYGEFCASILITYTRQVNVLFIFPSRS